MSGTSYNETCPRCGGTRFCFSDWKPIDTVSGICYDCGFTYDTKVSLADIEEVNEFRVNDGLELLAQLAEPTQEWLSSGWENLVK